MGSFLHFFYLSLFYFLPFLTLEYLSLIHIYAGDIGAVTKFNFSKTNDTLCMAGYQIIVPEINFSTPYYGKAIVPVGKSNEEKITNAINKLLEEDPTLQFKPKDVYKRQHHSH